MLVAKRNGTLEPVSKHKIQHFLGHAGYKGQVVDTILKGMPKKIASKELNAYFAATLQAAGHGLAAGRVEMLNLHKNTSPSFTETMLLLSLDTNFQQKVMRMQLDEHILHENDFTYDLFALRTLQRSRVYASPVMAVPSAAASSFSIEASVLVGAGGASVFRRLASLVIAAMAFWSSRM